MKIELSKKEIPRGPDGDPAFQILGMQGQPLAPEGKNTNMEVLGTFTEAQVVYMVNKYIYFTEAQQKAHGKRAERQRATLKLVRRKCRELFGVSWDAATEAQQQAAVKAMGGGE